MYIFRPKKEYLYDAMAEAKTFSSKEDVEKYLSQNYDYGSDKTQGFYYEKKGGENSPDFLSRDDRIGWNNIHYVFYHGYMIGYCSDDFDQSVWNKKAKKYIPHWCK